MRRSKTATAPAPGELNSFLDAWRYFLTPQLGQQVQAAFRPGKASRWQPQPLLFVLLTLTWCSGGSSAERFEAARAFYGALYQKRRRPGTTGEGFHKALARVPLPALRLVAAAVRRRLALPFAARLQVSGFVPIGCGGSRVACPRSAELGQRSGGGSKDQSPPMPWVTARGHPPPGLLWSWRLGNGTASERRHLRHLVAALPRGAPLVAGAGYVGDDLPRALRAAEQPFLIRLTSRAPLYAPDKSTSRRYREGLVYYWPRAMQKKALPPVPVRLLRLRGQKADVWPITDVLEESRLPRRTASQLYRGRWRNGCLFRTYKRT